MPSAFGKTQGYRTTRFFCTPLLSFWLLLALPLRQFFETGLPFLLRHNSGRCFSLLVRLVHGDVQIPNATKKTKAVELKLLYYTPLAVSSLLADRLQLDLLPAVCIRHTVLTLTALTAPQWLRS